MVFLEEITDDKETTTIVADRRVWLYLVLSGTVNVAAAKTAIAAAAEITEADVAVTENRGALSISLPETAKIRLVQSFDAKVLLELAGHAICAVSDAPFLPGAIPIAPGESKSSSRRPERAPPGWDECGSGG